MRECRSSIRAVSVVPDRGVPTTKIGLSECCLFKPATHRFWAALARYSNLEKRGSLGTAALPERSIVTNQFYKITVTTPPQAFSRGLCDAIPIFSRATDSLTRAPVSRVHPSECDRRNRPHYSGDRIERTALQPRFCYKPANKDFRPVGVTAKPLLMRPRF